MVRELCKEMLAEGVGIHELRINIVRLAVVSLQVGARFMKMIQVRIPAGRFL